MFEWLRKGKAEDVVHVTDLQKFAAECERRFVLAPPAAKFICPENGSVLDGLSIRKYVQSRYPDVIPRGGNHDLARDRKAKLLEMADQQEAEWGGPAPVDANKGD